MPSSFKEFEIPDDCIFQPPKDMVANLGKKQYVAKAKVCIVYTLQVLHVLTNVYLFVMYMGVV